MLLLLGRGIAYADVAVINRLDSFSRLVNSYGPHSGCPVFTSHTRILSYEADASRSPAAENCGRGTRSSLRNLGEPRGEGFAEWLQMQCPAEDFDHFSRTDAESQY